MKQTTNSDCPKPDSPTLVGPFEKRQSGTNSYELLDANGIVGIWVVGRANADRLLAALNSSLMCGFHTAQ